MRFTSAPLYNHYVCVAGKRVDDEYQHHAYGVTSANLTVDDPNRLISITRSYSPHSRFRQFINYLTVFGRNTR